MNNVELYARQRPLNLSIPSICTIVGLGGTGSPTAMFLAMSGVLKLNLFDDDILETSNLARIPLPLASVSDQKTHALAEWLQSLRPDLIITRNGRADVYTLQEVDLGEFLFDCTDNVETQTMLKMFCDSHPPVHYIRVGYNGGNGFTVTDTGCEWTLDAAQRSTYEIIPSCALFAFLPAILGVAKAIYDPTIDFPSGDWTSLFHGRR